MSISKLSTELKLHLRTLTNTALLFVLLIGTPFFLACLPDQQQLRACIPCLGILNIVGTTIKSKMYKKNSAINSLSHLK